MMLNNISDVKTFIANNGVRTEQVEVYVYRARNEYGFHTDDIRALDIDINSLPDTFPCEFEYMSEEDYHSSVEANSCETDFEDGEMRLVVALPYDTEHYLELINTKGELDKEIEELDGYSWYEDVNIEVDEDGIHIPDFIGGFQLHTSKGSVWVYADKDLYYIDIRTGLEFKQYPKRDWTLEEAFKDATNAEDY